MLFNFSVCVCLHILLRVISFYVFCNIAEEHVSKAISSSKQTVDVWPDLNLRHCILQLVRLLTLHRSTYPSAFLYYCSLLPRRLELLGLLDISVRRKDEPSILYELWATIEKFSVSHIVG